MLEFIPKKDPYESLGVSKTADEDGIKKAYRKLVLKCHPDKTKNLPEDEKKLKDEQFHEVQQAYELLLDPRKRREYDDLVDLRADAGAHMPDYRASSYSSKPSTRTQTSKPPTTPTFNERTSPIYETRAPKGSHDEDFSTSPKYEDRRPTSKRRSGDRQFEIHIPSRKSGGKSDHYFEDSDRANRKQKQKQDKEQLRTQRDQRKRSMQRNRRDDNRSKHFQMSRSQSDVDSELDEFMGSGRKSSTRKTTSGESRRVTADYRSVFAEEPSRRTERPRRTKSEESSGESDDERIRMAKEHIHKSSGIKEEAQYTRRSSVRGGRSSGRASTPPPAAPVPPTPTSHGVDDAKRSSARKSTPSRKPAKEKKKPDIVEATRSSRRREKDERFESGDDYDIRSPKKSQFYPSSPPAESPRNISQHLPRSSTFQDRIPKDEPKQPRRSYTQPTAPTTARTPPKPSRLENQIFNEPETDSEFERETRYKTTKKTFRVRDDEKGATVVNIIPEKIRRDSSPRSARRVDSASIPYRPSPRGPPARSQTFDMSSRSPPSGGGRLFGEVEERKLSKEDISFAKRMDPGDIRFTEMGGARRGSMDTPRKDRGKDVDPYRDSKTPRGHPGLSRNTSYAREVKTSG